MDDFQRWLIDQLDKAINKIQEQNYGRAKQILESTKADITDPDNPRGYPTERQ